MRRVYMMAGAGVLAVLLIGALAKWSVVHGGDKDPAVLRLGLVSSLFRETPHSMIGMVTRPLQCLMEAQIGITGQLESTADAASLAKQIEEKQVDLGIFHGFEFAWVRQKNPDLQPLLLVHSAEPLQAFLVVANDSKIQTCSDLKGKVLALPLRSQEHLHLFLERRCLCGSKCPKEFFGRVRRPADAGEALDDLLAGTFQAALIDWKDLEAYRKAKPASCERLRVLLKSEVFPAGVIACRKGALPAEVQQRIQTGMSGAGQTQRGRELLRLCRMANFDLPPAEFDQHLQTIAKAYPPPPAK